MSFFNKNKTMIGGVAVVLLCILLYFMYFSGGGEPLPITSDEISPVSKDLLITIQNLHSIKLDNSIFSDQAFISLTDFGVTIPKQDVGRRNPFLPVGQ